MTRFLFTKNLIEHCLVNIQNKNSTNIRLSISELYLYFIFIYNTVNKITVFYHFINFDKNSKIKKKI